MTLQQALKPYGKATLSDWSNKFISIKKEKFIITSHCDDHFFDSELTIASILLSENWLPFEKFCDHEPDLKMRGLKEMLELPANSPLEFQCKKCLRPLKAEKWVEA